MCEQLKLEDVMSGLEQMASLTNCNNMRYLEGCGHFCKVLREPIDDMAGGRSPKCNELCEHYTPPRDEELFRAALALLREKDAEIERLKAHNRELDNLSDLLHKKLDEGYSEFANEERSEAITEFAERLKASLNDVSRWQMHGVKGEYFIIGKSFIDRIAEEMKGAEDE